MTNGTQQNNPTIADSAPNDGEISLGKRVLFMVFFAIALRLAEFVVYLLMAAQFIAKAANKKPIDALTEFGDKISQYMAQIVRFQTFNTDELPFPFGLWPQASNNSSLGSPTLEREQRPGTA